MKIPPGQITTDKFPIMTFGSIPDINLDTWELQIYGLIQKPITITWQELQKLPKYNLLSDFHCVTQWSRINDEWEGVLVSTLIKSLNITALSDNIMIHCYGGYTTNVQYSTLIQHKGILAYSHNQEPLKPEHGGPLRLVLPERYAWKSAKWVKGLQFTRNNNPGFWESRGYHMEGDPWKQQRFE
ncbi:MAG: sulfite oxidase-like oxidoreductase [SAR202 cluster bacterium]|nr:sulfite oxidase-like oxidoreductase [Chloroflexota bacterium]MQG39629.1 sulfite oxidase-like oxidoreductase [SAR202 cluster bacterium]|tara:strand:- start:1071 stop:1622 length:552 start_codon:yes stop_codon:yes gene_type:complete